MGLTYTEAFLGGNGCIPIHGMMEDAATAEIARTQVRLLRSATLAAPASPPPPPQMQRGVA